MGTATSCETPEKRAENCTQSLSIVRRRVAELLTFSTISPFLTNAAGTRVCALTLTARYGVRPLSAHHSQMARTRYGLADCSDMVGRYYPARARGQAQRANARCEPTDGASRPLPAIISSCRVRRWSTLQRTPAARTAVRRIS